MTLKKSQQWWNHIACKVLDPTNVLIQISLNAVLISLFLVEVRIAWSKIQDHILTINLHCTESTTYPNVRYRVLVTTLGNCYSVTNSIFQGFLYLIYLNISEPSEWATFYYSINLKLGYIFCNRGRTDPRRLWPLEP